MVALVRLDPANREHRGWQVAMDINSGIRRMPLHCSVTPRPIRDTMVDITRLK